MAAGLTQASSGHIFRSNVKALETTARSSVRLAHALDSTISTLVSKLSDPPFKNQQRILTWLATAIQDNADSIDVVATYVNTNTTNIATNATAIQDNADSIDVVALNVATNAANIQNNADSIDQVRFLHGR